MKKALAMILALALAVILCVSCSRKNEEAKTETTEGLVTYTIYNRTGETVDKLTFKDNLGKSVMTGSSIPDGSEYEFSMTVVLQNGAPSLTMSFETKTSQCGVQVMQKDTPITLLPVSGDGEYAVFSKPQE